MKKCKFWPEFCKIKETQQNKEIQFQNKTKKIFFFFFKKGLFSSIFKKLESVKNGNALVQREYDFGCLFPLSTLMLCLFHNRTVEGKVAFLSRNEAEKMLKM